MGQEGPSVSLEISGGFFLIGSNPQNLDRCQTFIMDMVFCFFHYWSFKNFLFFIFC